MKKIFFTIAVIGLILGFSAHCFAVLGVNVQKYVPFVWILHIGVFVVWIPAVLHLNKNKDLKRPPRGTFVNPLTVYKKIFKGVPVPITIITALFFVYAMFNFLLFMRASEGGGWILLMVNMYCKVMVNLYET